MATFTGNIQSALDAKPDLSDLASATPAKGAALVNTEGGVTVQSVLDGMGWFNPNSQTNVLARAFETSRGAVTANGTTSDTTALTTWETAVTTYASGGSTVQTPKLTFGPRRYALGSISKMSFAYEGQGPDNTRLIYNGTAGADFITQDNVVGRNSAGRLANMSIDGGTAGVVYRLPQNAQGYGTDDRLRISEVRFYKGAKQIYLDAWVNFHVNHLRHDNWTDAAIVAVAKTAQNQSSFQHGPSTFDHNSGNGGATPDCFARFDNSALAASGNIGIAHFHDARWEFNVTSLSGTKSVISTIATGPHQVEHMLTGVTIQNTFAGGVDALFYRAQGGTLGSERYNLRGVQMSGITAVFKGDYPAWMTAIPAGNYLTFKGDFTNGIRGVRTLSSGPTGEEIYTPATSTIVTQLIPNAAANASYVLRPDVILSGTGSTAPVVLLRMSGKTGWGVPTGTFLRTTFTAGISSGSSATYTQTEMDAALARIAALEQRLAALINDLHGSGSSSPHGLLRT